MSIDCSTSSCHPAPWAGWLLSNALTLPVGEGHDQGIDVSASIGEPSTPCGCSVALTGLSLVIGHAGGKRSFHQGDRRGDLFNLLRSRVGSEELHLRVIP